MSTQLKGLNVPRLDTNPFKFDNSLLQRLKKLPHEFSEFLEHLKFSILIPLSWYWTMFYFFGVLVWRFLTMPLRLFVNFYEYRVRGAFPRLPSIWGTLFYLFPEGIKFPTFTSLTAGPYKGAGPIGIHPTLDVDVDSIINGGQPNGVIEGGSGDPSSQVNANHSKLETALKNLTTFSPGDLDAGLEQVKAAQAETEKSLKLTSSE